MADGGFPAPSRACAVPGPVNVARGPHAAMTLAELAGLGVARVTFGPSLQRQVYGQFATSFLQALIDERPSVPLN